MAVAFVQANAGSFAGTDTASAALTGVTTGNAIVVGIVRTNDWTSIAAPSDATNGSYTGIGSDTQANDMRLRLFYKLNVTGGDLTVTVTNPSTGYGGIVAYEVSGVATSSALDQETSNTQSSLAAGTDAITSGSVTTTTNGQMIVGFSAETTYGGNDPSAGTDYTSPSGSQISNSGVIGRFEYRVQTSAGSIAATFTTAAESKNWITKIATFKAAASGPTLPVFMHHYFNNA